MTDERDPQVTRRYRELGSEEPPRAIDEAILSAARAPTAPHAPLVTPAGRHRWYFGLAAAAVLVLSVAVTLHMERQAPDETFVPSPAQPPAAVVKSEPVPPPKPEPVRKAAPAPQKPKPKAEEKPQPQFVPDPVTAPASPAAGPAPGPAHDRARADQEQLAQEARRAAEKAMAESAAAKAERELSAQRAGTSAPPPMARAEARREGRDVLSSRSNPEVAAERASKVPAQPLYRTTPEVWLKQIAYLRANGRHEEADRELDQFRKTHPGHRLSDELREKVERK